MSALLIRELCLYGDNGHLALTACWTRCCMAAIAATCRSRESCYGMIMSSLSAMASSSPIHTFHVPGSNCQASVVLMTHKNSQFRTPLICIRKSSATMPTPGWPTGHSEASPHTSSIVPAGSSSSSLSKLPTLLISSLSFDSPPTSSTLSLVAYLVTYSGRTSACKVREAGTLAQSYLSPSHHSSLSPSSLERLPRRSVGPWDWDNAKAVAGKLRIC